MADKGNNYDMKEYNMKVYEYGPVKGKTEYYKKVVKTTTTTTSNISNINSGGGLKKYTSATNKSLYSKANGYGKPGFKFQRSNSFQKSGTSNNNRSYSSKDQFSYAGTMREKNNYVYYVSGIGFVNKNDENKKNNQETKEIKVIKKIQKPPLKPRPRPETIVITQKKEDTGIKELVDNYQYHETKDLKQQNKKSLVTHTRLSDPFYRMVRRSSKERYSSYTQQPKGYKSTSSLRNEYEVVEPTRTIQNVTNLSKNKTNYRTQKIPGEGKYNYFSSKHGSQSLKNYNNNSISNSNYNINSHSSSNYNINSHSSSNYNINSNASSKYKYTYNSQVNNDKNINNIGGYKRRDLSEGRKYISSGGNQYKNTTTYERTYEERRKPDYATGYNNIKRHEIKVTSREKKGSKTNINTNLNTNITNISRTNITVNENKKYIPQVVREQKIVERTKITNINNLNKQNEYSSKNQIRNEDIEKKYGQRDIKKTEEVYEEKQYYLDEIKRRQQEYQRVKGGQNIPYHVQQIAVYEKDGRGIKNQSPANNIPQTVHEIEINEKIISQNIPQHVQQIEVHEEGTRIIQGQKVMEAQNEEQIQQEHNEEVYQENQENIQQESAEGEQNEEVNQEEQYQENEQDIQQGQEQEHEEQQEEQQEEEHEEQQEVEQEGEEQQYEQNEEQQEIEQEGEEQQEVEQEGEGQQEVEQEGEEQEVEHEEQQYEQQEGEEHEEQQEDDQQYEQQGVEQDGEHEGNQYEEQQKIMSVQNVKYEEQNKQEENAEEENVEQDNVEQNEEEDNQEKGEIIQEENTQQMEEVNQEEKGEVTQEQQENIQQYQEINQAPQREYINQQNIQYNQNQAIYQQNENQYIPQQQIQQNKILQQKLQQQQIQQRIQQQKIQEQIQQQRIQEQIEQQKIQEQMQQQKILQQQRIQQQRMQQMREEERRLNMMQQKRMQYPPQNIQQVQNYYQQERRFIPQGNIQQIQEVYEERREYIPQQNIQRVKGIYPAESRGGYIPQRNKNIQNMQQQIYQEQIREYIPRQNIINEERRQYIPQQKINQGEEIYQAERRQFSQQFNNNNQMNVLPGFCPIHGMHRQVNRYSLSQQQQQQVESQRQFKQEFKQEGIRNESQQQNQQIYHTHKEREGMTGETNNYKFYESKNIKNNIEDPNSITLHYTRGGEEKQVSNTGGNSYSKVYVTTKSVPFVTDSNYQQYQAFSQSTNSYNNYVGQQHLHTHSHDDGNCPLHGKQMIFIEQQP